MMNLTSHKFLKITFCLVWFILAGHVETFAQNELESRSPAFSHESGFYENTIHLELAHANPKATIYFTLDGSVPDSSSFIYEQPIYITNRTDSIPFLANIPTTPDTAPDWFVWKEPIGNIFKGTSITAIAVEPGLDPSFPSRKAFFIHEEGRDRFSLPVVSLSMDPDHLLGDDGIYTNFSRRGRDWEKPVHIDFFETDGTTAFSTNAGIRVHGGNSRRYALKSLRLYFRGEYGASHISHQIFPDKDIKVFERLILRNSGSDWARTYFRDAALQKLADEYPLMDKQYFRPAAVFINGEFWGIMNIRDRLDNQYLETHHDVDRHNVDVLSRIQTVEYGSRSTYPQLIDHWSNSDMNNPDVWADITELMDVTNFMNYHILQTFIMNTDQPGKNVQFWRSDEFDGKWRWMIYDLDDAFWFGEHNGPDRNGLIFNTGLDHIDSPNVRPRDEEPTWAPNGPQQTRPLRSMLQNDEFRNRFIHQFSNYLNTRYQPDHVHGIIDSLKQILSPHMGEHIDRWHRPESEIGWENRIYLMKDFAEQRPVFMWNHLEEFFRLSSPDTITLIHDFSLADIYIEGMPLNYSTPGFSRKDSTWSGMYFPDIPLTITLNNKSQETFSGWFHGDELLSDKDTLTVQVSELDTITVRFNYEYPETEEPDDEEENPEDEENGDDEEESDTSAKDELPVKLALHPAFPNPFNPTTTVRFDLPQSDDIRLEVFDLLGQRVQILERGMYSSGSHTTVFDAGSLSSGVYIIRLQTSEQALHQKVLLAK